MKKTPTYIGLVLSIIGLILSIVALAHYVDTSNDLETLSTTFCKVSQQLDCKAVNKSEYSTMLGVPLGAWGISYFLGLLLLLPAGISGKRSSQHRPGVFLVISIMSVGYSIYLFLLSELVIKAVCPICLGVYIINLTLLAVAVIDAWGYGVYRSISHGIRDLLQLPVTLLITKGDNGWRSYYCLLAIFTSIFVGYASPDLVLSKYLLPLKLERNDVEASKQLEQLVVEGLSAWKAAPIISDPSKSSSLNTGDFFKGPIDAPVQIVEFSDMECPYCRQLYFSLEELLNNYKDKILLTFKNYPLDQSCNNSMEEEFHLNACYAATSVRCAGEQGKFWEALHAVFSLEEFDNGSETEVITAAIDSIGDKLQLDLKALEDCKESTRTKEKIGRDILEAETLGLQGTPFLIINGRAVENPRIEVIKAIVDDILSSK